LGEGPQNFKKALIEWSKRKRKGTQDLEKKNGDTCTITKKGGTGAEKNAQKGDAAILLDIKRLRQRGTRKIQTGRPEGGA